MPCDFCKKKGIPMNCNYCPGHYCSRCINLDTHECKGVSDKKEKHIKNLKNQLKYKVSTTLPSF